MHIVTINDAMGNPFQYDADMVHSMRTADDGIAFYISQLAGLQAQVYQTLYPDIIYRDLIPVDTSDPEWVDSVQYISYNAVTMGKFIAANGMDLPQSDITASISTIPVGYAGTSYGYSLDELRKAMAMRIPLDTTKARMSYRGSEQHCQQVAFFGDSTRNMGGLFNNANVPLSNLTVDWPTATGQDLFDLLNGIMTQVWTQSKTIHTANTLLLPPSIFAKAANMKMSEYQNITVLEFFRQNNTTRAATGRDVDIRACLWLEGAGTDGGPRVMAYEKNADNLTLRQPLPWRSLPPQAKGLRLDVPCEYKTGGTEFRYPLSAVYADAPAIAA